MSWRTVVVTGIAKIDYKMDYLVVRKQSEVNRIHLSEISLLMIDSTSVSMTTFLLQELVKRKTKVIFCDSKHNPISELMPLYGSHDCSLKIRQQIKWDEGVKTLVWTEIVSEKIKNQARHLKSNHLHKQAEMLDSYVTELEIGDATNREGHAAKVYFNALLGKDFSRDSNHPINAALNYGYGLLLSMFNKEIVSNGYLTQLGLFHSNMFNGFNLSSDLMEPLRPLVDRFVLQMEPRKFEKEEKYQLLNLLSENVDINKQNTFLSNAIKIYCKSVFDALNEQDLPEIQFIKYEL